MTAFSLVVVALVLVAINPAQCFQPALRPALVRNTQLSFKAQESLDNIVFQNKKNEPEKYGWEYFKEGAKEVEKKRKEGSKPPIYEPGSYPVHILAALAYLIPLTDVYDMGKYMFEAFPELAGAFNTTLGPLAAIYNGVPFLSFAVFFLMSYICRAPTFPVEVRFHFAQAFMISLVQFVPSLLLGFLEKGGVPGMAIAYNTVFTWVVGSCVFMQILLVASPIVKTRNPFLLNIVGWAMRYMNYTKDMTPK